MGRVQEPEGYLKNSERVSKSQAATKAAKAAATATAGKKGTKAQ